MDDASGILRLVKQALPEMINSGLVASVTSGKANVYIGSKTNLQPCSYDPSSPVVAGDRVIVVKAPLESMWSIVAVTFRKTAGVSNNNRETPNNRAGAQRFANASTNGNGVDSITAASGQLLVTVPMNFNGGKALVIHNGYATIASGSSALQLQVGVDGGGYNVYNGNVLTTPTPVNFSFISPTQLFGPHSIQLYAGRTSANVSLTNYQFIVAEI